MFRVRLLLAMALLAVLALLEGGTALWARHGAQQQVQRGRLTSDILKGYVELSANKQRLRSWTAQRLLSAEASDATRERLLEEMHQTLASLRGLSSELDALETHLDEPGRREERQRSLQVLGRHLDELGKALAEVRPLAPDADGPIAWRLLAALFDQSQGQDLRLLLNAEIAAERQATQLSRAAADRALATMRGVVLALSLTVLLTTVWLAWYFTRSLRRPIDALTRAAEALQAGELGHRIPLEQLQMDEFGAVARSFNRMAAELQQHRAQEQADRVRLEEMVQARTAELREAHDTLLALDQRRRRFFADVSHELRTPATAIRGEAEVALRGRDKPVADYQAALTRIVGTVDQFAHLLDDLTLLARSDLAQLVWRREPLDPHALLQQVCEQAQGLAAAAQLHFDAQLPAPQALRGHLLGDAKRLQQLFMIVLENALRYSRPGGRVSLQAQQQEMRLCVVVRDAGIGIPAQELPQVFERHFRGRLARVHRAEGMGLGLPIALMIAQAHAAHIEIDSVEGEGSVVRISLPLEGDDDAIADR